MPQEPEARTIRRETRLRAPAHMPPVQAPEIRVRNFDEVYLPWTEEEARAEAGRCLHCPNRPCVSACPLGNDVPGILWLTETGDFDGAARLLRRTSNLAEVCSRVCPQDLQCQRACPHPEAGGSPVAIAHIERFLADRARRTEGWHGTRPPSTGHRVAVVGSGPAGLTVAELLALEGHCITVYDRWPHGGGMLRYGIPRFKLDHRLVQKRLDYLHEMGVEFVFDTRIGEKTTVDDLLSGRFEAVFLGTGAAPPARGRIPGDHLMGVHEALSFLVRANVEQNLRPSDLEDPPEIGDRVAVLGMGEFALDCCRTALRLGASEVTCFHDQSDEGVTGCTEERRMALEEGVCFEGHPPPIRILGDSRGRVRGLQLGGTWSPSREEAEGHAEGPASGALVERFVDTVVLAQGVASDPGPPAAAHGLRTIKGGFLATDPGSGRTSQDRVWAAGGNVLGAFHLAKSVAQARIAAGDIHLRLTS